MNNNPMKRRNFLKGLLAGAGTATLMSGNPLSFKIRPAHAAEGKTLIVVFQRGGCDGLNVVVPFAEPNYYAMRPTLAIAPPDPNNPNAALNLNGSLGLHPSMSAMHDLFLQGQLAVMPTVHYPNASRSHFSSQHYIETAKTTERNGEQLSDDGWLNRHMQSQIFPAAFRAVSMGRGEIAQSLVGSADAKSISSLADFSVGINEQEEALLLQRINSVYGQTPEALTNHQLLHRFGSQLVNDLGVISQIRDQEYVPDNGAIYPNNSFARDLRQVAQLIKSGVGLELATVNIGGWDTHANQANQLPGLLTRFSESIAAFNQDMGGFMNDVVVLTCTEFGRTAHENGSQGTDHGHAASWFAIGGGIQGGIYGQWPGLEEDQLNNGRFLESTLDCHDVYGDIVSQHLLNNDLSTVLPQHNYNPVGLFE